MGDTKIWGIQTFEWMGDTDIWVQVAKYGWDTRMGKKYFMMSVSNFGLGLQIRDAIAILS